MPAATPRHDPSTHYCIVRTDLPVGLAFAQLLHASGESSPGSLSPGTYAVALGVPDEGALEALADRLDALGVPVHRVVESHGLYAGQLMALGLAPGPKSVRGQHLSSLPLLRMQSFQEFQTYAAIRRHVERSQGRELRRLRQAPPPSRWERLWRWWGGTKEAM